MKRRNLVGLIGCAVLAVLVHPLLAQGTLTGPVLSVTDGDTIRVLLNGVNESIRLYGVDCPETNQPHGSEATAFTTSKVLGKTVILTKHGTDHGRIVAEVQLLTGDRLGELLTAAGLAWWDHHFAPELTQLGTNEVRARAGQLGLWKDANQIPPWVFRDSAHPKNIAVLRGTTYEWFIYRENKAPIVIQFGGVGDVPVPADYLGLGTAQIAVFRPTTREWFIRTDNGGRLVFQFGGLGDLPIPGDYDETGHAQLAVFRPSNRRWYIRKDNGDTESIQFGGPDDQAVPAEFSNE